MSKLRFSGANGLAQASETAKVQDRDGTPLKELPAIWDGLTAKGVTPPVTQPEHLPNAPFAVDDPKGFDQPLYTARGIGTSWHRFYQNQMQINGGKNNMFAA